MQFKLLFLVLVLTMVSCQRLDISSVWMDVPPNSVLFQDDFSNTASGWKNHNDSPFGSRYYVDGGYRIKVNSIHSLIVSTPGLSLSDTYIYVNATKHAGPDDDNYGILCRWRDNNNFYFMVISSDGYYGIGKLSNGHQTLIGKDKMLPSEVINQGLSSNHLRVDCVGDSLSLYVNGEHLISVIDTDFTYGDVGLLAGTFGEPGTDILFSNFSVIKP